MDGNCQRGCRWGDRGGGFSLTWQRHQLTSTAPLFPSHTTKLQLHTSFFSRYFACDRWMKRGNRAVEKGARGPHVVESANALHHSITNSPNNLDTGRRGVWLLCLAPSRLKVQGLYDLGTNQVIGGGRSPIHVYS